MPEERRLCKGQSLLDRPSEQCHEAARCQAVDCRNELYRPKVEIQLLALRRCVQPSLRRTSRSMNNKDLVHTFLSHPGS